jgi:beta-galactosidase
LGQDLSPLGADRTAFPQRRKVDTGAQPRLQPFQNESLLACYRAEAETLREITPHITITTNLMGAYEPLDYHSWAKEMDVASFDNYPSKDATYAETAFNLALTRGLREGQPWLLVEQHRRSRTGRRSVRLSALV